MCYWWKNISSNTSLIESFSLAAYKMVLYKCYKFNLLRSLNATVVVFTDYVDFDYIFTRWVEVFLQLIPVQANSPSL